MIEGDCDRPWQNYFVYRESHPTEVEPLTADDLQYAALWTSCAVRPRSRERLAYMSYICKDCGMDTTPCTGKRGCRHKGRYEHYMVHNKVWAVAGMTDGFLCIGCLERRIGRRLSPQDFTKCMLNDMDTWDTPRLANRKTV